MNALSVEYTYAQFNLVPGEEVEEVLLGDPGTSTNTV